MADTRDMKDTNEETDRFHPGRRRKRAEAAKSRICTACLVRPALDGINKCEECNTSLNESHARRREEADEEGLLCIECLANPRADRLVTRGVNIGQQVRRCEDCLERNNRRSKENFAAAQAAKKKTVRKPKKAAS
jgi:hypothetical protein